MTTRLGKAASFKRKAAAWLAAVAITLGCGTTAFANNSPENDYETDSTHILISEADTTIAEMHHRRCLEINHWMDIQLLQCSQLQR